MYNPFTGKTYNELSIPHPKGLTPEERRVGYMVNQMRYLNGFSYQYPNPQLRFFESHEGTLKFLVVPFEPLSLLVNFNLEQNVLWLPFLESIGIEKDNWWDSHTVTCFALINLSLTNKDNSGEGVFNIDEAEAIVCTGFSLSTHHMSLGFRKENWFRIDRTENFTWCWLENCFEGFNEAQFVCIGIEEQNFGFAMLRRSFCDLVLINTYNQFILHNNSPERHFHFFQPKKIKNEIYIIATRKIPSKKTDSPLGPSYEWNIYSLSKSKWLFRKTFPKGLAFWKKDGSVLILLRNLWHNDFGLPKFKNDYLDLINEMGFAFSFVDRTEFEDILIGKGRQKLFEIVCHRKSKSDSYDELDFDGKPIIETNNEPSFYWKNDTECLFDANDEASEFKSLVEAIDPVPLSVITDIVDTREEEEEYREIMKEESNYGDNELNNQGWREILDSDPDWPFD